MSRRAERLRSGWYTTALQYEGSGAYSSRSLLVIGVNYERPTP